MWGKRSPIHCWWECKLAERKLVEVKIDLIYDLTIFPQGIYQNERK